VAGRQPNIALGSKLRPPPDRLHEVRVELEVPFHDVDILRVVWHGHYYKYLEIARTALMRSRGLDGADFVGLGLGLMVIESQCRYVSPLRYGDRVEVAAWFRDLKFRIMIGYEVFNLTTDSRAARARTSLVTTTLDGTMYHRTPNAVLEKLAPHLLEEQEEHKANDELKNQESGAE
jgi:acyl-CoA thioester hydrolase